MGSENGLLEYCLRIHVIAYGKTIKWIYANKIKQKVVKQQQNESRTAPATAWRHQD